MRVLHVVDVSHGGVISLVRIFAAHQVEAGHDVHLLLPPKVLDAPGTVHRWLPERRRPMAYPAAIWRLRHVVRQVQPDVVHLHSFFPGLYGRFRPLPGHAPVVYQPHSWAFQATSAPVAPRIIAAWEIWAARRTDAIITNCAEELREATARGLESQATVVGLPVDTDRFHPVSDTERLRIREDLGFGAQRLIVCVGRLSRQKGQDLLASAWERRPVPDTALVLVGPGDPEEVAALAPKTFGHSLHAVGAQADVRQWLWAADLCVQPSRYEGQSVAVGEALACGRPVLMTRVNGAVEAVAPPGGHAAGAVVPIGDMDQLLDACVERLQDPDRVTDEGREARARAVALFRPQDVMARIDQVYADVAGLDRAAVEDAP